MGVKRRWFARIQAPALRAGVLASMVLLFGGCVRAEIAVHVDDDGSGTASVLFGFKKSLLDLMSSLDESGSGAPFDPADVFSDVDRGSLPEGTKVEPYDADGFVGSRITMPFRDVQELPDLLKRVTSDATVPGETAPAGSDGGFERFAIARTEQGWRLDAVAAPLASEQDVSTDDEFTQQFLKDASFTIKVRLPGKVGAHNADEVHGNELTWKLDLQSTQPRELRAETSGSGSGSGLPWVLIGGGVVGALALGGIGWDIRRRKERHEG